VVMRTAVPEWVECTELGVSSDARAAFRRPLLCTATHFRRVKPTVTVMTTGTGVPFNNVGVNVHCETA